ncbi:MAG: hypothetical protein NTZ09_00060 [Candidatus Hydrogenedentes bacterium]|nr:hypothetical protein [Candidatus Hydrogenedentota bacterium]
MIFQLAQDFHAAVDAMPRKHPKHRMLELIEEAILLFAVLQIRHSTTR